jgi:hypothetical protein
MKNLILPVIIAFAFITGLNAATRYTLLNSLEFENSFTADRMDNAGGDTLLTIDEIKTNVNLTDSQSVSVDSILTDAAAKLQAVTDPGDAANQAKAQIVNNAYASIKNILTDDQRTKFDILVAQKSGY